MVRLPSDLHKEILSQTKYLCIDTLSTIGWTRNVKRVYTKTTYTWYWNYNAHEVIVGMEHSKMKFWKEQYIMDRPVQKYRDNMKFVFDELKHLPLIGIEYHKTLDRWNSYNN
jgi:hypothetical protein